MGMGIRKGRERLGRVGMQGLRLYDFPCSSCWLGEGGIHGYGADMI